jgi:hypothetical protein
LRTLVSRQGGCELAAIEVHRTKVVKGRRGLEMRRSSEPLFQLDDAFRERHRAGCDGMTILEQSLDEQILCVRQLERPGGVLLLDARTQLSSSALRLRVGAGIEGMPHVFERRQARDLPGSQAACAR